MRLLLGQAAAAAILPLAAVAQSADLSGFSPSDGLAFTPEVTQAAAPPSAAGAGDASDVAKKLNNPNSPLAQLTFTHIYTQYKGDLPGASNRTGNVTQFQPAFPFPIGEGTNLFIRPLISYVWDQPVFDPGTGGWDSVDGFADIGFDLAIGKSLPGGLILIGGLQGTIPTDTDVSGEQWRLGPEFAIAKQGEKTIFVAFPSHQWNLNSDSYDYSTTSIELIAGYFLPDGWTLLSDSTLLYDHEADQWTVPINATIRKVTKFGNTPVQFSLGLDYYVEQNDVFGQDWAVKFKVTPVVENFIYNWIKG